VTREDVPGNQIADGGDDKTESFGDDHLARLSLDGFGSTGFYTPEVTEMRLGGVDRLADLVVFLHEAHHASLNDSTAWGAAVHVLARLGAASRPSFLAVLEAARQTHESYATYASVSVALAHDVSAEVVLAGYPNYLPLHRATARFVAHGAGPHRRYLAATAAARVAMQCPIMDLLIAKDLAGFDPAELREIDTPDGRWRWLLRRGPALCQLGCDEADRVVRKAHGTAALEADVQGRELDATADELDPAWGLWEAVVYDRFAIALAGAGASPLTYNGHQDGASRLVAAGRLIDASLPLRVASIDNPAPDDRSLAGAAIESVRLHLAPVPWRAEWWPIDPVVLAEERASQRIDAESVLIIDVRLPRRLLDLYRWPPTDAKWLGERSSPVVASRLITGDETESVITHCPIDDPEDLRTLVDAWSERGPALSIVSVSALIDRNWVGSWLQPLGERSTLVMLIDVELDRFVANWTGGSLSVTVAEIVDASGTTRFAAAFVPTSQPVLWLFVADEASVKLLVQQVAQTGGVALRQGAKLVDPWRMALELASTHLLATESFVDLKGLEGQL
jgi:hypothetical protein